jgi:hypothetical protein
MRVPALSSAVPTPAAPGSPLMTPVNASAILTPAAKVTL